MKWNDILWFCFIRLTVDVNTALAEQGSIFYSLAYKCIAISCLMTLMRGKESTTFHSHFVETIFHLNDYMRHKKYNQLGLPSISTAFPHLSLVGEQKQTVCVTFIVCLYM